MFRTEHRGIKSTRIVYCRDRSKEEKNEKESATSACELGEPTTLLPHLRSTFFIVLFFFRPISVIHYTDEFLPYEDSVRKKNVRGTLLISEKILV
jgi:hypothetical protein